MKSNNLPTVHILTLAPGPSNLIELTWPAGLITAKVLTWCLAIRWRNSQKCFPLTAT